MHLGAALVAAPSADVQIGPSPSAQPAIGDREIEQSAAPLEQLARANFGDLDDAELEARACGAAARIFVGGAE